MAAQVIITIYDLTDGSSRSGLLVRTPNQQLGVFGNWPRPFIWNRPAAAVVTSTNASPPEWIRPRRIEVTRTHANPAAGVALVSFDSPFDGPVPVITPPPVSFPAAALLAAHNQSWTEVLATTYPVLADIESLGAGAPRNDLPDPGPFAPAVILESLNPDSPPSWRICKILMIC